MRKDQKRDLETEFLIRAALFGDMKPTQAMAAQQEDPFITLPNGDQVVCLAQGGECRFNSKFYTPGMGDTKSWTVPQVDHTCPNRCGYKMVICRHEQTEGDECPGYINYYPQYDKYGLSPYCRRGLTSENKKQINCTMWPSTQYFNDDKSW